MNKEILFAQKLGEIRELAKEQGNYVTKEQIADAFAELNFQEEQFQMVYDYLTKHKIGIDEPVDLDEYLSLIHISCKLWQYGHRMPAFIWTFNMIYMAK